jgi:hypothetical protein
MIRVLEMIFEKEPSITVTVYIYVSLHPNVKSIDFERYEKLKDQIEKCDEIYEIATSQYELDVNQFEVYSLLPQS